MTNLLQIFDGIFSFAHHSDIERGLVVLLVLTAPCTDFLEPEWLDIFGFDFR